MSEKVKPIVLKDTENGDEFTLEFNRESVRFAESKGFNLDDLLQKPVTTVPDFFYYAFRMHHRALARNKVDAIFEELGGLTAPMIERLTELYTAPYDALIQDEEGLKNSKLTVVM